MTFNLFDIVFFFVEEDEKSDDENGYPVNQYPEAF
jgi:hypothetical protein